MDANEQALQAAALKRARNIYGGMKQRCLNPNNTGYARYGGRGIAICARWLDSFDNFLADMGLPPSDLSIDRINNDGNYEPGNCRWADRFTQANNHPLGGPTRVNADRTHCVHGHELAGDNVRITYRGRRECRVCHRQRCIKSRTTIKEANGSPANRSMKLNPAQVLEIRNSQLGCRRLASLYGVSKTQIQRIRNGLRWANLKEFA